MEDLDESVTTLTVGELRCFSAAAVVENGFASGVLLHFVVVADQVEGFAVAVGMGGGV